MVSGKTRCRFEVDLRELDVSGKVQKTTDQWLRATITFSE
jgi:hypothetical protein